MTYSIPTAFKISRWTQIHTWLGINKQMLRSYISAGQ
jgi:hypothetical protein